MLEQEKISQLRRDYGKLKLDDKIVTSNPLDLFSHWFEDAIQDGFQDPNAFALSTVGNDGKPSSRMLLLKGYDERGFVFYSNYQSRKALQIEENPYGCILFFWDKYERQVRIEGRIEKTTAEESDAYFQTRSYTSRLGAWASTQSRPLKSRFSLMRKVAALMLQYPVNVPLPPHWGGYRLIPELFEFWQGRESRLHDRFQYSLQNEGGWKIERLNP